MKKIFILEDEELIGKIYKKKLIADGFEVEWAKNIKEALEMLKNFAADCVLIDHGIRGEKEAGLDIVPKVRISHPKAKLIMLSNYKHVQLEKEASEKGVHDFLVKLHYPPSTLSQYLKNLFSE